MAVTKDSLFFSAVRSFLKSFATLLGICLGLFILLVVVLCFSPNASMPDKPDLLISPDADGNRTHLHPLAPTILRIDVNGVIGIGDLTSANVEEILLSSREDVLSNNRVKGILLHINTPGGTVTDSDNIYRALLAYKKKYNVPVYSYIDGMCASGGMYIASASDKIFASPSSVIGSVGVILGPTFNFSQAMDKLGVQALTITEGKDKDMLNPFRPWKAGEADSIRAVTSALYQRFVDIVSDSRKMLSKEKLIKEYGAQVYIASTAQNYGYIDNGDSSYSTALKELVSRSGIQEKTDYQVVTLQIKHPFLSQLTQGKFPFVNGKITHTFQISPNLNPELSGKFLYLYQAVESLEK